MTFITYWLQYELAGLWPLISSYGLGGLIIIALLAAAWFSPVWKKEFLWAASAIAIGMAIFSAGVVKGERRVHAQWEAARENSVKVGKEARSSAERSVARKPSRWLPNHRDPNDRDGS